MAALDQTLTDNGPQVDAQIEVNLPMPLRRKKVNHALHRLVGVIGVQRCETQVSGLGEIECILHRLFVANLAQKNYGWRLPQGIL